MNTETDIQARLDEMGAALRQKAQAQIGLRYEIELRWLEDLRQYHGRYSEAVETRLTNDKTGSSRIFVNLTRPKCEALESRLCEMLFPTDDRNWLVQATPNPELAVLRASSQEGQDQATMIQDQAKLAAEAMQRLMDDQLTETDYSERAKQAIHDAVLYGTGILKGPVVTAKVQKQWTPQGGIQILNVNARTIPRVEVVNPWDFFPDMSAASLAECEFIFERRYITKKTLRLLAQRPGYRPESIREALRDEPRGSTNNDWHRQELRSVTGQTVNSGGWDDTQYEWWQYHGPIEREDALALGLDIPDDPLLGVECVIELVGDRVIRAEMHPLDTQDPLYSVYALVPDDSTIFGYGIPYLLRAPQTAINAAWRMMLDNAALSVGPQIVINQNVVKPADGVYALSPRKVWLMNDPTRSVNEAFAAVNISSYQPEMMAIFETARALIEKESNIPDLMQGDIGSMPAQTASGMSMAMNAANTVLRRLVKRWDDEVTKTLIRRFYDYNMQYSELQDVKGDFEVDARGSSALMVKETQSQALLNLIQVAQAPAVSPLVKWPNLFRKVLETLRLSPDELAYTDDELAQQQQAAAEQQAAMAQQQQQGAGQPAGPSPDAQAKLQADAQMKAQQMQVQTKMHQEELAMRERLKAAELGDKERQRQYDWQKEQIRAEQLDTEARLKTVMGSGL